MSDLHVMEVGGEGAADVVAVIHVAFGARPQLDPPSTALQDTADSVGEVLGDHGGLLALVDGEAAGALLFEPDHDRLWLRRVSVDPRLQQRGVASALVGCAEEVAGGRGYATVSLTARVELPATQRFWLRRGYVETAREGVQLTYSKALPVEIDLPAAADTFELGRRLAGVVRPGDLVLLAGSLGSGKTTLTQGIGAGMQVRDGITSPTFVLARVHRSLVDGPPLVHVDAYRLGGLDELDDLDLDTGLEESVTVVEWGEGLAETLAAERLDVAIQRGHGMSDGVQGLDTVDAEPRRVKITPVGRRWLDADLAMVRPVPSR